MSQRRVRKKPASSTISSAQKAFDCDTSSVSGPSLNNTGNQTPDKDLPSTTAMDCDTSSVSGPSPCHAGEQTPQKDLSSTTAMNDDLLSVSGAISCHAGDQTPQKVLSSTTDSKKEGIIPSLSPSNHPRCLQPLLLTPQKEHMSHMTNRNISLKRPANNESDTSTPTKSSYKSPVQSPSRSFSPCIPANARDLGGYVGCVTPIRSNQANTRKHFWVHVKIGPSNFIRLMVSNHCQMQHVRQELMSFFHNKQPIMIGKIVPGKECYYYNNYSTMQEPSQPLNFSIDDTDATLLSDIDEEGEVLSLTGKVKFTEKTEIKNFYNKQGNSKSEKKRNAIISDGSHTMTITVWGDLIDSIKENTHVQFHCITSKFFNENIELSTKFSTSICYLSNDIPTVDMETVHVPAEILNVSESILCTQVVAVKIEKFNQCFFCPKKKLEQSPHDLGLYKCPQCKRDFHTNLLNNYSMAMTCYVDVMVDDSNVMAFTIHDKEISSIFGVMKKNVPQLKMHILSLKDFTVEFHKQKKNILSITTEDL